MQYTNVITDVLMHLSHKYTRKLAYRAAGTNLEKCIWQYSELTVLRLSNRFSYLSFFLKYILYISVNKW